MRVALLTLLLASPALAGPLLIPGQLKGAEYDASKGAPPQILFSHVKADITAARAEVKLEEVLKGEGPFALILPLAEGGEVTRAQLGGWTLEGRHLKAKDAEAVLTALGKAREDTRLLSLLGRPLFIVDHLKLQGEQRLIVELKQPLRSQDGMYVYEGPMSTPQFASGGVERARFSATIKGKAPIRAAFSDTHTLTFKRPSPEAVEARYAKDQLTEGADLRLFFVEDKDPLGLRFLTHREGSEAGHFLLLGNPSGGAGDVAPEKDLILALDASGSMRGEKWEQSLSALSYILDHLGPKDRFNVITFGTEVKALSEGLHAHTPEAIAAAKAHLDEIIPVGRTNISEALKAGLSGAPSDRARVMIFLTDGTPTAGEQNPKEILKALAGMNTSETQVFALGVGDDVNPQLLDAVASKTKGSAVYVSEKDALDTQIAALYDRLSHPALSDLKIDFGDAKITHVHPEALGTLFKGVDLLVMGRFEGEGARSITVSGLRGGARKSYTVKAQLPKATDGRYAFIPALWAARRIGDLLGKIRLEGAKPEWVEEVVALSHRYGVVTEYTRFMAEEEVSLEEAQRRASGLIGTANRRSSGRWAVQQAVNESNLRNKMSNDNADNAYFDRRGARKQAKSKIIGNRAFYKRGDRWVESTSAKRKPRARRKVKRFSKEYMDLVKKDKAFSEAQQLDANVTVFSGDELIEVE